MIDTKPKYVRLLVASPKGYEREHAAAARNLAENGIYRVEMLDEDELFLRGVLAPWSRQLFEVLG